MIHKHLEFNEGSGCICESEADTITNALKQEWGGFNDVLRKAFHNETILSSRRAYFEYTKIEAPKLSLSITGTPNLAFLPSRIHTFPKQIPLKCLL